LAGVAKQSWSALEAQAMSKNVTLSLTGVDQTLVTTDRPIVGRIFSNLLSNAVEYSPAGAAIEWNQEVHADRVVVTLANPTGNLEEADLPHLAEPFWRKDASRTGNRHAGLGLALVACYAQRLNIKVRWTLPRPGVFQVALEFPRYHR
jgi:two-component system heavy metal sensor histidine kinase CusS